MTELEFTLYNDKTDGIIHQMGHLDIDEAVSSLGMDTVPGIGLTVNVPTGHKIRDKHGVVRPWSAIGQRDQVLWFVYEYFPRVIAPYIARGILVFELTKKNNVHFHLICWDETIQSRIDMAELQHTINNCVLTNSINKGRHENAKVLNYIHFLNDQPDWIAYLKKSQYEFGGRAYYYPYFWNHWSPETPLCEVSNLLEPPGPEPPATPLVHARTVLPTLVFPD